MKKCLFVYALMIFTMIAGTFAYADQRCDMDTQNCHISLDPNDDDTEIDVPASIYSAQVNRYVDGDGVRKANGSYRGYIEVPLASADVRPPLLIPHSSGDIFTKGNANTRQLTDKYVVAANTQCNLVRSNFQENTGSDDQNQIQYTSNDWELSVTWHGYKEADAPDEFDITDDAFDLNIDGVVDLDDFSIYRARLFKYNIGIWYVAMNCRAGIEA